MHLKKLACEGFKSFADPIEFRFEPGMTAIVGPNGCGKSNVVDAFRWVLGERSAKGLRGQEMLDVIFKGTRKRDPLNRAEVSLVFENEDRTLPMDTNEVEVARRLYRSGESEYLINRQKCRLKDVLALFQGTGIGTDGYSVLEQGSVDGFLNSNPQERRAVFEEAAGISKFKKDRQQSMRQLDRVEQNLARTGDVLAEVERRLSRVRQQAARAERFIADRDRYHIVRSLVAHIDLETLLDDRQLASYEVAELQARRAVIAELARGTTDERDGVRDGVDDAQRQLTHLREVSHEFERGSQRVEQRRSHIAERREEIADAERNRRDARSSIDAMISDYESQRESVRERLRESILRLRELRTSSEEVEASRRVLVEKREALVDARSEAKRAGVDASITEARLAKEVTGLESEINASEQRAETRRGERAGFQRERAEIANRIEKTAELRDERASSRERAVEDAKILSAEIERRTASLDATERDAARVRDEVEKTRARITVLEDMERTREGIGGGARRLLDPSLPLQSDALGLLADQIHTAEDVAPLVDAALADSAQIVCFWSDCPIEDRVRHARRLLDESESAVIAHVGRDAPTPYSVGTDSSSQLPAAASRPTAPVAAEPAISVMPTADPLHRRRENPLGLPSLDEVLRRWSPVAAPAAEASRLIDQIRVHPAVRALVETLIGDVEIVDDLDEAFRRRAAGRGRRFVTRIGDLVELNGSVSLRSRSKAGLVSRRTELFSLRETLAEREREYRKLDEAGSSLRGTIDARIIEERRAEERAQRDQIEWESHELRIGELEREVQRHDERLEAIRVELAELADFRERSTSRLAEAGVELEAIRAQREECDAEVERIEASFEEIDGDLQSTSERMSALRVEMTQAEERAASLRREERGYVTEIEERRARIESIDREGERDTDRLRSFDDEEASLDDEHVRIEAGLEENRVALAEIEEKVTESRARQRELEQILRRTAEEEDRLRSRREEVLLADGQLEVKIAGVRTALHEELELDVAEVPYEEWIAEVREDEEEDQALQSRLRKECEELSARLKKNANVNLEAVEELSSLEERFEGLSTQIEDLESSREQLEQITEELNRTCRERFAETFEHTRRYFGELFATIFGGGTADLILVGEDPIDPLEAGIEVKASPPGKRINSLKLMSGGEKALTAVAVLFALFRTRPSPFCLLDEVDAPLDEANNRRYVRILQEFAEEAQFLVVTHSKTTMAEAQRLYGVTMEEEGVSRLLSVRLEEAAELAEESKPKKRGKKDGATEEIGSIRHPLAAK